MAKEETVRAQFDKQAKRFSSWSGTRSEIFLQELFDFMGIRERDELLDVACGSGEFALFCARRVRRVHGVDISPKMIELATEQAEVNHIRNVSFECHNVKDIPCNSATFSVVLSRSAFHHMEHYPMVFAEMVRCCWDSGLLCVEDVMGYDTPRVSAFFDGLDTAIDLSHNMRISEGELRNLFLANAVEILKATNLEYEIDVRAYASHAIQLEEAASRIDLLLENGLNDPEISKFLYKKDDKIVFRNRGIRVLGRKTRRPL